MKKLILIFSASLLSICSNAQPAKYESSASIILDRMSDFIGDLQSCSFKLNVEIDNHNDDKIMVKDIGADEVFMVGPDKMLVNTNGLKGHRSYFYNGNQLAYYSHDENNYGIIDAPATIMETITEVNANYGLEFPAADFFYPSFTDDLIESSQQIKYLGKSNIGGKECFHLISIGSVVDAQFWISNDAYNLPMKFVLVYKTEKDSPQYEATFSDWQINPTLPDAMFNFVPPPGANEIRIVSKNEN